MTRSLEQRIRAGRVPGWTTSASSGFFLHIDLEEGAEPTLAESVARTLGARPPWLHFRWLYDAMGSAIYEQITGQPEYYLTRAEDRILRDNAANIRDLAGDVTLVELGSGSSRKTRRLLDAWTAHGEARYVPIDISRSAIEQACGELSSAYPGVAIEAMVARYARALPLVCDASPLLLLFLGSSIGNFDDEDLEDFLTLVSGALGPDDRFLLGIDLVKDKRLLDAAYNDAAGWTERFMLNVLTRMNRELGTRIPLAAARYEGAYREERERVEMRLSFDDQVIVAGNGLPEAIVLPAGTSILMEISRKFRVPDMVAKLGTFGFGLEESFTDADEHFAVLLLTRTV